MDKIALITDSSCDLDEGELKKYNIEMLPFRIIYSDREYLDKIDITAEELYRTLKTETPTTSLPDLSYTEEVIERLKKEGYNKIFAITVSSKLSGTFNSLRLISENYPELDFYLFDTRTLGFPVGAITIQVAKMIQAGKEFNEIQEELESIRERVHGFITVGSLEHLIRGGRIGKVAGTIGQMLHLNPIISSSDEGVLYTYTKVRGRKKAISKLKEILRDYLSKSKCRVWVLNGDAVEEAKAFMEDIKSYENITEISFETIGPSMGIHTGPGVLGMCIYEEK